MTKEQFDAICSRFNSGLSLEYEQVDALVDEVERLTKREEKLLRQNVALMSTIGKQQVQCEEAFKRGAEAMRHALIQRVDFHSYMGDLIRAEPIPEDK